jgi:hypothetical protein
MMTAKERGSGMAGARISALPATGLPPISIVNIRRESPFATVDAIANRGTSDRFWRFKDVVV